MTLIILKSKQMTLINHAITILILLASSTELMAQTFTNKTLYVHSSAGLSRSEDGLKFMVKESAS